MMMPLNLVTIEKSPRAEVLTHPGVLVSFPLSKEDENLIQQMKNFLIQLNGVGLAAPQVGIDKQIIIINISEEAKAIRKDADETVSLWVLINPQYQKTPDANIIHDWEACFSVSEKSGKVPRYDKISLTGYREDGTFIQTIVKGFTARVLQHEIDHIQGILIVDRLTQDCIQGPPEEMKKIRIQELDLHQRKIFEEISKKQAKNLKDSFYDR